MHLGDPSCDHISHVLVEQVQGPMATAISSKALVSLKPPISQRTVSPVVGVGGDEPLALKASRVMSRSSLVRAGGAVWRGSKDEYAAQASGPPSSVGLVARISSRCWMAPCPSVGPVAGGAFDRAPLLMRCNSTLRRDPGSRQGFSESLASRLSTGGPITSGSRCQSVNNIKPEALEPIRQGVRTVFGGCAAAVAAGLTLRHDHGSQ